MKKTIVLALALCVLGTSALANSVTITNRGQVFTVSVMPTSSDRTDEDPAARFDTGLETTRLTVEGSITAGGSVAAAQLATAAAITATNAVTLTSAHFGKVIPVTVVGAVSITLPANAAPVGTIIDFLIAGTDATAPTVLPATADTLITLNDATATSVTYGAGHRIGAYLRVISTGAKWQVLNLGPTTLTVTS